MNEPCACFSSQYERYPWWSGKLEYTYKVTKIELLARNTNFDYLSGANITIDGLHCGTVGNFVEGKWITVNCLSDGITGNRIQINARDRNSIWNRLEFCGIKVYGLLD